MKSSLLQISPRHTLIGLIVSAGLVLCLSADCMGQDAPQNAGTIRGKVVYEADPARPWRLGRYYIRNATTGELAEAIVAIAIRGRLPTLNGHEPQTVVMDQKNFQFVPETLAIQSGDSVRFLNSDDHTHNVKTDHPKHSFNVTMPVGGEHVETFADASGIRQPYVIDCVFHSAMKAWIFVFDHPWYALTDRNGRFELQGVPAGEYRLDVVHAAGNLRGSQTIRVTAGQLVEVEIRLRPK